jgi:hypothetical protein
VITILGRQKEEVRGLNIPDYAMPSWDEMPKWNEDNTQWNKSFNGFVDKIKELVESKQFNKASKAWDCLIEYAIQDFQGGSGYHHAEEWFHKMENTEIFHSELTDRITRVNKACQQLIDEIIVDSNKNYAISSKCAISLCRGVHTDRNRLSLPFLKTIFGENQDTITSPFQCVETGRVSPGRVLLAIYTLMTRKNKEVLSVTVKFPESEKPKKMQIKIIAKYDSFESADYAAQTLKLTPFGRLQRDRNRNGPGEAVESCDWLRQAAEQDTELFLDKDEVSLSFYFPVHLVE